MLSKLNPRFCAWALIVLTALLLFFRFPAGPAPQSIPGDFAVYHRAAERASHGQDPYVVTDPSPYKYSPGVLALVEALPKDPARAWFWYGTFCIALFALSLAVSGSYSSWKSVFWLAAGLALSWKGLLETFDYGQLEVLLLALGLLAAALLSRGAFISGVIAGFMPWLKLPWLLLLLPFMTAATLRTERRGRLFFSGYLLSCFTWGAAVPSLLFGADRAKVLSQSWLHILRAQPLSLYSSDMNQSIWISATRWFGNDVHLSFGLVGILLGLILGLMMSRALDPGVFRRTPALAWISPWMVLTQLLSPLSWRWGSVFVVGMPMAAGWNPFRRTGLEEAIITDSERVQRNLRFSIFTIIGMLWLLQMNPVARSLGFGHWTEFHSVGLITAFWLSLLVMALI